MKKIIMALCLLSASISVSAESYVTFCYWTVSSITEAKDKDGNVEYSVNYRGATYILNIDQYNDLLAGKDITLKVE